MNKYIKVNYRVGKMPTDILTDEQVVNYQNFKEEIENEGIVTNVAGEFMEEEDILEVNQNIPDVEKTIYEIAEKYNLENNVDIYETYKYNIIRAINLFGAPLIIDSFRRIVVIDCEAGDTPQSIINKFSEAGIDLDDVNASGQYGDKMIWSVNGEILTVKWDNQE